MAITDINMDDLAIRAQACSRNSYSSPEKSMVMRFLAYRGERHSVIQSQPICHSESLVCFLPFL